METVNMDYLATGQIEAEDVRELVWRQECRDNPGRAISGNRMDGLVMDIAKGKRLPGADEFQQRILDRNSKVFDRRKLKLDYRTRKFVSLPNYWAIQRMMIRLSRLIQVPIEITGAERTTGIHTGFIHVSTHAITDAWIPSFAEPDFYPYGMPFWDADAGGFGVIGIRLKRNGPDINDAWIYITTKKVVLKEGRWVTVKPIFEYTTMTPTYVHYIGDISVRPPKGWKRPEYR